jgi:hypothetical protein
VLAEGADPDAVASAIARQLPEGLSVHRSGMRASLGEETMLFLLRAMNRRIRS